MKHPKRMHALLVFLLAAVCVLPFVLSDAEQDGGLVTPALHVIANSTELAKNAPASATEIRFAPEDFDGAVGGENVSRVTVVQLPSATDGKLMLGTLEVFTNQVIARERLSELSFVPAKSGAMESSFRFAADGMYTMTCNLFLLDAENQAPSAAPAPLACGLVAVDGCTAGGKLRAADPEGDALHFVITRYPSAGVLTLVSSTEGTYRYTPVRTDCTEDRFSYVAVDRYGNTSAEQTVSVRLVTPDTPITYVDIAGTDVENVACFLADCEIMVGKQVAGAWVFSPDEAMSRAEFLALAVRAAGYSVDSTKTITGFADEEEIPELYRACVAVAAQVKLIAGEVRADGVYFRPNDTITRAEAALILSRLLDAPTPAAKPAFADEADIPVWAAPAVYAMYEMGVFAAEADGKICASAPLSRADTAELLAAVALLS